MGKSRKGFVTNSSSSSFIFKGHYNVEGVYYLVREIAEKLLKVHDKLTEAIEDSFEGSDLLNFVKTFDKNGSESWHEYFKAENKITDDYKYVTSQFIEEAELFNVDAEEFITNFYLDESAVKKCKDLLECETYAMFKEKKPFEMDIYNIANLVNDEDNMRGTIIEMLTWYNDDLDDDTPFGYNEKFEKYYSSLYSASKEELCKIALEKLGDVAISSTCGYIPYILVDELVEYTVKHCNHMG